MLDTVSCVEYIGPVQTIPIMKPDELMAARKAAGVTRMELAAAIGVHERTVYRWERGEHPISKTASITLRAVLEKPSKRRTA